MSSCATLIFDRKLLPLILIFSLSPVFAQVPDSAAIYRINKISISGNRKTKSSIILRELSKKQNDTLTLASLRFHKLRIEQNIFNTQLFIYDTIYPTVHHDSKTIDLKINVKERWYVWPAPVFEIQDRNFNTWWQTKDLFRINYGFALGLDNFTGVKDRLVFLFQRGYTEKYGFSYRLPYLNKSQTLGFNLLYVFSRNNEVTYKTYNNKPLFVRDYKSYLRSEHEGKAGIIYRPNLYEHSTFEVMVRNSAVQDTVALLNPHYFGGEKKSITYGSLQYRYTFDDRDNKSYPLKGWAFDLWAYQDGLNFSNNSDVNILSLTSALRKHTRINHRFYLANMIKGRLMNPEKVSFLFNRALGYSDELRGYEYYVIDGQRYFLTRNCLRYQILKPHIYQFKNWIGPKQFNTIPYYAFISLYADAGYVEDKFYSETNTLTNSWQYGYGIGLDFVTYYDLVLRLEFSMNRQKQHGFFIHMTSGF